MYYFLIHWPYHQKPKSHILAPSRNIFRHLIKNWDAGYIVFILLSMLSLGAPEPLTHITRFGGQG